jgi:hypothetical protein
MPPHRTVEWIGVERIGVESIGAQNSARKPDAAPEASRLRWAQASLLVDLGFTNKKDNGEHQWNRTNRAYSVT